MTAEVLGRTELFAGLPPRDLEAIAARGIARTYPKGQILFYQHDPGESLYVILEGRVKAFVTSELGTELNLGIFESPAILGEVALVDGGPRSASAEVVAPAKLLVFTRTTFLSLLGEHPALVDAYLRTLGKLIRRLQDRTEDLVFLDLHGRVAKLLLSFAEDAESGPEGTLLDLKFTQGELAAMVAGSRPTVNQILKTFEGRGYLTIAGRQIVVKDEAALRRLAGV
ncbi:MAG TPA: Crp/Fnr family transcriptional regulator [Actinomycetota bacterium]|nr:Crp/Fnr family transcriptional regulator [Actinomycetota bacterium]